MLTNNKSRFLTLLLVIVATTTTTTTYAAEDSSTSYWSFSKDEHRQRHLENGGENLVLVMGMPRSASLSIHNYFKCQGLKSSHYCCGPDEDAAQKVAFPCKDNQATCGSCVFHNMNASQPAFEGCGEYDVMSGFDVETGDPFAWFLPQHFTLPLLHEHYPKSTWILNARETPERWADNVMHWYSVTNRMMNSFGLRYHKDIPEITVAPKQDLNNELLYKELEKSIARAKDVGEHIRRRDELAAEYRAHTDKIKAFAAEYPGQHKLIEVDVDADPATVESKLVEALSADAAKKTGCWEFDAKALDEDWKDFSLKV